MISVKEAEKLIAASFSGWESEELILEDCIGKLLMQNVYADRDYPPYHRVTMDGYAFHSGDILERYPVSGIQLAGDVPVAFEKQTALEIMTGAALPAAADCVIPYEKCQLTEVDGIQYTIPEIALEPWRNIHTKGSDAENGSLLISSGTQIHSQHIAVAASVGLKSLKVKKSPRILLVSTGDELSFEGSVLDHQIRPSNTISIQSMLKGLGLNSEKRHLKDDSETMAKALESALVQYDLFIFSGGVSKGKADHLPHVLKSLGVEEVFHRIAQRPGKPLWFGKMDAKLFFGLPGNPISSATCFIKYVLPLIHRSEKRLVRLAKSIKRVKPLTHFVPAQLEVTDNEILATEVKNNGSGDFISTSKAHGFIELPPHETVFENGSMVSFYPF